MASPSDSDLSSGNDTFPPDYIVISTSDSETVLPDAILISSDSDSEMFPMSCVPRQTHVTENKLSVARRKKHQGKYYYRYLAPSTTSNDYSQGLHDMSCCYSIFLFFRGYFEENPRIPIYHTGDMNISTEEALRIILNPDKTRICREQPFAITFSSTYVVYTSLLTHRDDLRADDLGSWRNDGVKSLYFKVSNDANGCIAVVVKLTNKKPLLKPSIYRVKRSCWHHSEDSTFACRLIEIEGKNIHVFIENYVLIDF